MSTPHTALSKPEAAKTLEALREYWRSQFWPVAQAPAALSGLARQQGCKLRELDGVGRWQAVPPPERLAQDRQALGAWLDWQVEQLGLESEAVDTPLRRVPADLAQLGCCVIPIAYPDGYRLAAVTRSRTKSLTLLSPEGKQMRCPVPVLVELLSGAQVAGAQAPYSALVARAGLVGPLADQATRALAAQQLAQQRVGLGWQLRRAPSASTPWGFSVGALASRWLLLWALMIGLVAVEVQGWALMGSAVLQGRLDGGVVSAWILLLLSGLVLAWMLGLQQARTTLDLARGVKQRLFRGALQLPLNALRANGNGRWLGVVLESQALEALLMNGGLSTLTALAELALASWVLAHGPSPGWHLTWLGLGLFGIGSWAWRTLRSQQRWTTWRLGETQRLIARMVGHRTVVAQEPADRRLGQDDAQLAGYLQASQTMDARSVWLHGALPQFGLMAGLALVWPAFVQGLSDATVLGIALGGLLLALRGLSNLAGGVLALGRASQVLVRVQALLDAAPPASGALPPGSLREEGHPPGGAAPPCATLIDADGLRMQWPGRAQAVLEDGNFRILRGQQILLQGASGSGKSTLAAVLTGLHPVQQGVLRLHGLDLHSLGAQWTQRVVAAPQFHQNHLFTGTLAQNLLMGRESPASEQDLQEAQSLCQELGLGELLARMPGGLQQAVGESGWQLSHGEKSRVFLARALLQRADLVILDESFAALDPDTLGLCLACALRRAPTLMVIAHP